MTTLPIVVSAKDLHQMTETAKSRSESALEEAVEAALGHLFADHIRPASEKGEFKVTTRLGASTEVETLLVQRLTDLGFAVVVAELQPGSRRRRPPRPRRPAAPTTVTTSSSPPRSHHQERGTR